nr:hypothetical protein GCM10020063_030150 [Dactylosporangium thailandense]
MSFSSRRKNIVALILLATAAFLALGPAHSTGAETRADGPGDAVVFTTDGWTWG